MAGVLCFWAFNPPQVQAKGEVNLSQILKCEEKTLLSKVDGISEGDIATIKSATGDAVPVEIFNDLTKNISSITKKVGTTPEMTVSYCTLGENAKSIENVSSYFAQNSRDFGYGSLEQVVDGLNSIPYVEILNVDSKVPTMLVRTKPCNKPLHKSDFYFFASVGEKNIVMFQIHLKPDNNATNFGKRAGNLIQAGQYIKYKLYCNE
jgi:hypothetical protein